jgi:hypothetical protein
VFLLKEGTYKISFDHTLGKLASCSKIPQQRFFVAVSHTKKKIQRSFEIAFYACFFTTISVEPFLK